MNLNVSTKRLQINYAIQFENGKAVCHSQHDKAHLAIESNTINTQRLLLTT